MCQNHKSKIPAAREAGRLHGADHDWHSTIDEIARRYGWCRDLAIEYVQACRSEIRRRGGNPESRSAGRDGGPFRS